MRWLSLGIGITESGSGILLPKNYSRVASGVQENYVLYTQHCNENPSPQIDSWPTFSLASAIFETDNGPPSTLLPSLNGFI